MRSESSGGREVLPRMRSEVIIGSIETDDFAFPGDVSFTLNVTMRVSFRAFDEAPRQVAPLRHAARATYPASTGGYTPGRAVYCGVDFTVPRT